MKNKTTNKTQRYGQKILIGSLNIQPHNSLVLTIKFYLNSLNVCSSMHYSANSSLLEWKVLRDGAEDL